MKWNRERVIEVYRLYCRLGTYAHVGQQIGLSRERVRQILGRGRSMAWIGSESYRGRKERGYRRLIERLNCEIIIRSLLESGSRAKAARHMELGVKKFDWLCSYYGIDWRSYRRKYLVQRLVDRFSGFVFSQNGFPSTYRLQRLPGGKALYHRILSYFKSYEEFIRYYRETVQSRNKEAQRVEKKEAACISS